MNRFPGEGPLVLTDHECLDFDYLLEISGILSVFSTMF